VLTVADPVVLNPITTQLATLWAPDRDELGLSQADLLGDLPLWRAVLDPPRKIAEGSIWMTTT
jgi:hypothetical protein